MRLMLLTRVLIAFAIVMYILSALALFWGIYPWPQKINDPNNYRIFSAGNKFLWALIFSMAAERIMLTRISTITKNSLSIALMLISIFSIIEAIHKIIEFSKFSAMTL